MNTPRFKTAVLGLALFTCLQSLFADGLPEVQAPMAVEPVKKTFVFALMPKSFQGKPLLAITVMTEVTDEGKLLQPPTSLKPVYYQLVNSGYHKEGGGASQQRSVSSASLEVEVKKSLTAASYLECSTENPASLLLFMVWGEHNRLHDPNYRNLLNRAQLVGGQKFAEELAEAIEGLEDSPVGMARGARGMGTNAGDFGLLNPVYQFCVRNDKNRALYDQVIDDCYYVVVSAYDKAAFERGERKLLWRTKMTTAAQSVSLAETSTALAASGAKYYGRWMTEASIIDKRISRKGTVTAGETRTVSMDEQPVDGAGKEKPSPAKKK